MTGRSCDVPALEWRGPGALELAIILAERLWRMPNGLSPYGAKLANERPGVTEGGIDR